MVDSQDADPQKAGAQTPRANRPKPSTIVRAIRALRRRPHRSKRAAEEEHRENERAMARWAARVGWFTVVLVGCSAANVVIIALQLGEMRSGGIDTHSTATATADFAEAMKRQSDNTAALAASARASAKSARDSLDSEQRHFRIDERPILTEGPVPQTESSFPAYDINTKRIIWSYSIRNVGKSTALDVKSYEFMSTDGSPFENILKKGYRTGGDIAPSGGNFSTVFSKRTFNKIDADAIISRDYSIIPVVITTYRDSFSKKYTYVLCRIYRSNEIVSNCTLAMFAHPPQIEDKNH